MSLEKLVREAERLSDKIMRSRTDNAIDIPDRANRERVAIHGFVTDIQNCGVFACQADVIAKFSDLSGCAAVRFAPEVYRQCRSLLDLNRPVLIKGRISVDPGDSIVTVDSVRFIS